MGSGTPRSERWAQEKDEVFRRSLAQLREDIVRANALAREANVLAEELGKQTRFSVTLQIPPANLSPNRKRIGLVSEPAILVRRTGKPSQIWSLDKLDVKLVDMRDLYNEFKNVDPLNRRENPFLSPGIKYEDLNKYFKRFTILNNIFNRFGSILRIAREP
jgi:kinesin family protein 13